MNKKRIIFMGTPDVSKIYLESLINNKFNIVGVYTQPPSKKGRGMKITKSPVHNLASNNNIPVYNPINFDSQNTIKEFNSIKSDLVIVMGYGIILPSKILNIPKFGFINVHLSLLPRWKGASPIEHILLNGDKTAGISIFKIIEKLDSGPIIACQSINIDDKINKQELLSKLTEIGLKKLIDILPDYLDNKIKLTEQDEFSSTYAKKITVEMRKINFYDNASSISNQIRAFSPKPSAWFICNRERIKIIKSKIKFCNSQVSRIVNDKFHIGCNDGIIVPEILQRESKKPTSIEEFIRGYKFNIGQIINE